MCIIGQNGKVLIARQKKDPGTVVTLFLDALKSGDYDQAERLLSGHTGMGLNIEAETEEGGLMLAMLKNSYDYSASGPCARNGIKASQKILITRLDIPAVSEFVMSRPEIDYVSALREISSAPESFYTGDIVDINLEYIDREWKIVPDETLLTAVRGGLR